MNLDIGDILTCALQITWRHKILCVFNRFPVLVGFLFIPLLLIPTYFPDLHALVWQAPAERLSHFDLFVAMSALLALVPAILLILLPILAPGSWHSGDIYQDSL